MFTTVLSIALASSLVIRGVRSEFSIDTPAITQCQDVQVTWTATQAPYNLILVSPDDPCDSLLADLGDHNGLSMTWKPTLPAGTQVELSLQDANGEEAWSGAITIAASDDSSCLPVVSSSVSAVASSTASSAEASSSAASSVDASSADSLVAASSSAAAVDVPETTALTVAATFDTAAAAASATAAAPSSSSSGAAVAIGAANAGDDPFGLGSSSGAPALKTLSVSAMTFVAIAAAFVVGI